MQYVACKFNLILFNFFDFVKKLKYSHTHTIILYCLKLKEASLTGRQGFVLFELNMPH